jgi:hypothetical protein
VNDGIDEEGIMRLLNGPQLRSHLDRVGFMVLARAVPKTGVDTGLLRNSMDKEVVKGSKSLELHLGSNVSRPGQGPVKYAYDHWAPGRPGGSRSGWRGTQPWSRSLNELGVPYDRKGATDI